MQTTQNLMMVRPSAFGHNSETQGTNAFQSAAALPAGDINAMAAAEFDAAVDKLRAAAVSVFVFNDTPKPAKPDAVFPNNWVSFQRDGSVILYPMQAKSRRAERRPEIIEALGREFRIDDVIDLTGYEKSDRFLEGTGSIVFDHVGRIAYACTSVRTDQYLLSAVSERLGYRPVIFHATDKTGQAIYHTNVMMCVAERFAVVCLESISNERERWMVMNFLTGGRREIIDISLDQMYNFAGNMLALRSADGRNLLVLSQRAFESLKPDQVKAVENYCEMLPIEISTIETVGGGSARCMMAEIFLSKK